MQRWTSISASKCTSEPTMQRCVYVSHVVVLARGAHGVNHVWWRSLQRLVHVPKTWQIDRRAYGPHALHREMCVCICTFFIGLLMTCHTRICCIAHDTAISITHVLRHCIDCVLIWLDLKSPSIFARTHKMESLSSRASIMRRREDAKKRNKKALVPRQKRVQKEWTNAGAPQDQWVEGVVANVALTGLNMQ